MRPAACGRPHRPRTAETLCRRACALRCRAEAEVDDVSGLKVTSRVMHLPMAFHESKSQDAMARYQQARRHRRCRCCRRRGHRSPVTAHPLPSSRDEHRKCTAMRLPAEPCARERAGDSKPLLCACAAMTSTSSLQFCACRRCDQRRRTCRTTCPSSRATTASPAASTSSGASCLRRATWCLASATSTSAHRARCPSTRCTGASLRADLCAD
jgi:hypothetical protein